MSTVSIVFDDIKTEDVDSVRIVLRNMLFDAGDSGDIGEGSKELGLEYHFNWKMKVEVNPDLKTPMTRVDQVKEDLDYLFDDEAGKEALRHLAEFIETNLA